MKALTLTQPWATLVAIGAKRIETRSWSVKYRGPLAIHAAKGFPTWAMNTCLYDPFIGALRAAGLFPDCFPLDKPFDLRAVLPLGAIVATCELVDCQMIGVLPDGTPVYMAYDEFPPVLDAVQEPERSFGDYTPGRFAWLLGDIKALPEPIPAKGALGLWNYEGAL
jgi:activating signal cointegrator 1